MKEENKKFVRIAALINYLAENYTEEGKCQAEWEELKKLTS